MVDYNKFDHSDPKQHEEYNRLWVEEFKRENAKIVAEKKKRKEEENERLRQKCIKEHGFDPAIKYAKEPPKWDSPYTLDNWSATVLYIIVMVGGSIFHGNWVIWIVATIIYFRHLTRHNR